MQACLAYLGELGGNSPVEKDEHGSHKDEEENTKQLGQLTLLLTLGFTHAPAALQIPAPTTITS